MMTVSDQLARFLRKYANADVKEAIKKWAVTNVHIRKTVAQTYVDDGWKAVAVPSGAAAIGEGDDFRQVLWIGGLAYALRPEVHRERVATALKNAASAKLLPQKLNEQLSSGGCSSLIDGQLCGGTLVQAAVCPRCALGKQGVTATLTCDVCGHVTAIMREAK